MLKKNYLKNGRNCRVTFKYDNEENSKSATLVGDFNNWNMESSPMRRLKDGSFSVTVTLAVGQNYSFRYVLDGGTWVNECDADSYIANEYGGENSVISV